MQKVGTEILLAIRCLVYNHESYLRQCLDGFVKQKTNFRFVAIVHDDVSTDNSAAIIREYADKYPDIIKPIFEIENQYSKHDGSLQRIMNKAIDDIGAKYVAYCEGDDYWTDELKLQEQVDFLESHPDYSMCCHGADVLNETLRHVDCACEHMTTREYFPEDAFPSWQIPTASIVYRKKEVDAYPIHNKLKYVAGDVVLILKCMHVGRVWGFADHMSVYRMNQGGATSKSLDLNGQLRLCRHYEALIQNFPMINTDYCHRYIAMTHYTNFRHSKEFKTKIRSLWIAIKNKPSYVIRKALKLKAKPRKDLFYQYYGQ